MIDGGLERGEILKDSENISMVLQDPAVIHLLAIINRSWSDGKGQQGQVKSNELLLSQMKHTYNLYLDNN